MAETPGFIDLALDDYTQSTQMWEWTASIGETVNKHERRIGELEDELKRRNRRIEELRNEYDKLAIVVAEMRQHEDDVALRKQWVDAFDMVRNDKGEWDWVNKQTVDLI
jgi:TolA-binding protein